MRNYGQLKAKEKMDFMKNTEHLSHGEESDLFEKENSFALRAAISGQTVKTSGFGIKSSMMWERLLPVDTVWIDIKKSHVNSEANGQQAKGGKNGINMLPFCFSC